MNNNVTANVHYWIKLKLCFESDKITIDINKGN
jgi:hypothetical protein